MLKISKMLPYVSVIIPVYNQEKYIKECVESVLNHDYDGLEVIVVDDGSTDATPQILESFGEHIRYIRQENKGPAGAINTGIKIAKGSLIAWLGSDDLYMPGKIRYQIRKMQEDPSIAVVYTDYIVISADGKELEVVHVPCPPPERFVRTMLAKNFINGSTVLMKKECIEKVGYYDESLRADPDGDMWFRLLKLRYKFGHVPIPLVKYRLHSNNVSRNTELMRSCKDQVRLKAIETFSKEELFRDIIANGQSLASAYESLAWFLFRDFNFKAAEAALKKAYEEAQR